MKIVVNDYAGHAFTIELSRELATRGHQVTHTYCSSNLAPWGDLSNRGESGMVVAPISTGASFAKYSLIRRLADELKYGWRSGRSHRKAKPDVILVANMPIISVLMIWAMNIRTRRVLWLQDIQSGLADLVLTGKKRLALAPLRWLEALSISRSSHVVAISDSLAESAADLGHGATESTVIENWAPVADIATLPAGAATSWRTKQGLDDKFVFLYSGTLGMKHRPDLLIALAEEFRDEQAVEIVVVSESAGVEELRRYNDSEQAAPITLLPFQPYEELTEMLATSEILVVVLEQEAGSYSIPSKILSYLCAGRPILGSLPRGNSSFELIERRAGAGLATDNDQEFVTMARRLFDDATLRASLGDQGRRYAEKHFPIDVVAGRFEKILNAS